MTDQPRWIDYIALSDLTPAASNPKQHHDSIGKSISRFGYVEAITIDERTGRMVAGHGRHDDLVAKFNAGEPPPDGVTVDTDGDWLVPVQRGWKSTDDGEAAAYVLVSNQSTIAGGWDPVELDALTRNLAALDVNLDGLGFDSTDLIHVDAHDRTAPDPREREEVDERVTLGDRWALGSHRLICGDSTDPATLVALMGGTEAMQVWTDPPYGIAYIGKTADAMTISNDEFNPDATRTLLLSALGAALSVAAPGGTILVSSPPVPLQDVFASVLTELGVRRHTLVWVKDQFVLGRSDYHYRHEILFYGWKPGAAHRPPPDRTQDSIWEFARPQRSEYHPTMKPVPLVQRAIENHTSPGAAILDPFGGSGTTLLAADLCGRVGYLAELDPGYCDVILDRWERHGGVTPVLVDRVG